MGRRMLGEIARVVRSKNAGPFLITIDVILPNEGCYVAALRAITKKAVANAYGISEEDVLGVHPYPPALAIKVTIKRRTPAGEPGDTDVYGAQQHVPLAMLEVEVDDSCSA